MSDAKIGPVGVTTTQSLDQQLSQLQYMQNAATANGNGTPVPVAGYTGAQQVEIVESGGGTCTVTLQGSMDGTNSFALATVLSNAEYAASGGFAQNIGYLLGLPNTVEQGISGTGVVNTVSATKPTYQERIGDLTAEAPDIVWVWGSVNDIGQSGVQAATLAYLQAVRTALPNAFVLMTSPTDQVGSAGNITNLTTLEGSYSAACTGAGVPFINLRTGAPMIGTGYVGHTVGDGNRDVYTGSDDVHPAGAGMKYVAGRVAPLIQALLAATRFG